MNRLLDWIAAAIVMAALACAGASPIPQSEGCTTDTECQQMHGGDGGPAPAFLDCDGFDCGEDH